MIIILCRLILVDLICQTRPWLGYPLSLVTSLTVSESILQGEANLCENNIKGTHGDELKTRSLFEKRVNKKWQLLLVSFGTNSYIAL